MEQQLPYLTQDDVQTLKTQEMLDLLFLWHRYERFSDGILDDLSREIEVIMDALRERVRPPDREDRSQEELLRAPMFISYRAKKDPREIKILDPACGSGHFLLYCFDLLEIIYEEAYEDTELGPALQRDYVTLADLKKAIPGLVLAHNLHGIDIDLRATQIAALALWLRAQRAYQAMNLKNDERPKITRSNVVCAEPMPGEKDMLAEFVRTLQPPMLGDMVHTIFEKMQLANEAGSLLKIEEEIKEAVLEAKQRWLLLSRPGQLNLWPGQSRPAQQKLFEETGISNREFRNSAEAQVINALRQYAQSVSNGRGLARQLFADDVVQGFAFIDICQKQFDVVLMNPPFGEAPVLSSKYIDRQYPTWNDNLLCAFIERGWRALNLQGTIGAIYDRTAIVKSTYERFRRTMLVPDDRLFTIADLGWNVLDANVEVTTSVLCHNSSLQKGTFVDVRDVSSDEKGEYINKSLRDLSQGDDNKRVVLTSGYAFQRLPNAVIGYDFPQFLIAAFSESLSLEEAGFKANQGHALKADKHFRVWWEVPSVISIGFLARMFNGAGFSPYATVLYDCVIADTTLGSLPKDSATVLRNKNAQMLPGVCFGKRGEFFCAHALPSNHIFTVEGQSIPIANQDLALELLGLLNTPLVRLSLNKYCGQHKYSGYVNLFPYRRFADFERTQSHVRWVLAAYSQAQQFDETQSLFSHLLHGSSIRDYASMVTKSIKSTWNMIKDCEAFCHQESLKTYRVSESEHVLIESFQASQPNLESPIEDADVNSDCGWFAAHSTVSHILGCILGRWDIRMTLNLSLIPRLLGPFDPLPICPPGMLVSPDGLPATSGNIVSEEWLRARLNVNTLPAENEVRQLTIPDSQYPININREGILVDDPDHPDDIVRRVRDVLGVIWKDNAEAVEQEAGYFLGVKELRDYFRRPGNDSFWMDHVKRYSKSRRKAPIYWLLQSSKKNYALWLYYHRLDKDILFKALTSYVEPKLRLEEGHLAQLRAQVTEAGSAGREAKQLEKQLERQEGLMAELYDFRDKLRRAADLQLVPDLNDGVVLNIAPLWELVPWSEARRYWEELLAGKYEWSSISKQLRERGVI